MSVPDPALHDWVPIYAPGPTPISYGTSLPTNPIDGQEAILVDSITNPSYQWRFRYNAQSTSAYKWEFVGGSPALAQIMAGQSITTPNVWVVAAPSFTVPRAGDYLCQWHNRMTGTGGQGTVSSGISIGGAAPLGDTWISVTFAAAAWASMSSVPTLLPAVPVSTVLQHCYNIDRGDRVIDYRRLVVTPVRVS